jgi:hypothetical protein
MILNKTKRATSLTAERHLAGDNGDTGKFCFALNPPGVFGESTAT